MKNVKQTEFRVMPDVPQMLLKPLSIQ